MGKGGLEVYLLKCIPNQPHPPGSDVKYDYKIPGGKAEAPHGVLETQEETGKRELREEAGFKVKRKTPLNLVCHFPAPHHVRYVFSIERAKCSGKRHKGYRDDHNTRILSGVWVTIDQALKFLKPDGWNRYQFDGLMEFKEQMESLTEGLNVA